MMEEQVAAQAASDYAMLPLYVFLTAIFAYGSFVFARGLRRNDQVALTLVNVVMLMFLWGLGLRNVIVILFLLLVVNFAAKAYFTRRDGRMVDILEEQLANALLIISGALKAGRSLEQGFSLVERGMPSPISDEFRQVLQEQQLGLSFEDSLRNFMRRSTSRDYKLFLTATLFQRETGGNLIALYEQIIFAVSERRRLKGRLDNMTQQGRYSAYVMMMLPVLFCFFMYFVNPDRFGKVLAMQDGPALIAGSGLWMFGGIFWLWSVVNRKIG